MNTLSFKPLFLMSGLAGILVLLGNQSAHADSLPAMPQLTDASGLSTDLSPLQAQPASTPEAVEPSTTSLQTDTQTNLPTDLQIQTESPQIESPQTVAPTLDVGSEPISPVVAQAVTPGRATRSGPSYIGVGGNIGFGGSTDLGRGSFTAFSKIGLTNNLSARPAINIGSRTAVLLPITVDFPVRSAADGRVNVAPYIGGGVVISTGDGSEVRALATGGVDVPLSDQFTANAGVNVGFFGDTEVGVRVGIGYNF